MDTRKSPPGVDLYQHPITTVGQVNPYGISVDTMGNPILSPNVAEKLYYDSKLMEQRQCFDFNMKNQEHYNKMKEIEFKAFVDSKRDEARDLRKILREDSVLFPVLDSDARICLERRLPNDKKEVGKPIFGASHIHLKVIKSIQTHEVMSYLLGWDGLEKEIQIPKSKMNPNYLFRLMSAAGNPMRVGKNRKTEIGDVVFGYLNANASVLYMPEHWGWQKMGDKWLFCKDTNLKGVK